MVACLDQGVPRPVPAFSVVGPVCVFEYLTAQPPLANQHGKCKTGVARVPGQTRGEASWQQRQIVPADQYEPRGDHYVFELRSRGILPGQMVSFFGCVLTSS